MQTKEPLNTTVIEKFLQQVKVADSSRQKEIRLDIQNAKNLAYTLGIVMTRLEGDLEKFVAEYSKKSDEEVIQITLDGGNSADWK